MSEAGTRLRVRESMLAAIVAADAAGGTGVNPLSAR